MRNKGLNILIGLLLTGSAWAQNRGVITAIVLDENGGPVASAKVHITEKGVFVMHRIIQFHETDAGGHFRIAHVPWGTYFVLAGKEDAGYPDPEGTFYSNGVAPTVVLAEDSPTTDVTLKLGPKAGVLELEPVTDAITGSVIRLAAIRLKRADNPDLFIYASASQRRFLVPPLTEVLIEISAEGYKSWPTPEGSVQGKVLLNPEQVQKLTVALQPEEPGAPPKSSDGRQPQKPQ